MHDESLEPVAEQELRELEERALDRRIVAALEGVPELPIVIPEDFAGRVASKVAVTDRAKRPVAVRSTSYGRRAMWLGLVVVAVGILLFSVHSSSTAGPSVIAMTVESVLVLQFVAIVAWLSVRSWREG